MCPIILKKNWKTISNKLKIYLVYKLSDFLKDFKFKFISFDSITKFLKSLTCYNDIFKATQTHSHFKILKRIITA